VIFSTPHETWAYGAPHARADRFARVLAKDFVIEPGNMVKAFEVLGLGIGTSEKLAKELHDHAKATMVPSKYLRAIEFRDALPKTQTGNRTLRVAPTRTHQGKLMSMRTLQPPGWKRPSGYSNGVSASGRLIFVAGQTYREVMGKTFPAMSPVQVGGLAEDGAKVEIEATAMVPEDDT